MEAEKCLDSQLWHACAGGMAQMPPVNSKVFYFPQGHAEHAQAHVDFTALPRIPAFIPCRVGAVKFLADPDTDEVFAKIRLVSMRNSELGFDDDRVLGSGGSENPEKPASFAKTLTQSDANNGGGFSVPRYCAETIFPRLDYTADPPVQTVIVKDVHGVAWKFRHIYRGTPRRHLLTTGWSTFVNHKKLVAGDSVVFLRAENGDLCIGIRRAKRGNGLSPEFPSGWNSGPCHTDSPYGGFSVLLREDNTVMRNGCGNSSPSGNLRRKGKVRPESVTEAVALAAAGQPFEVTYYPRASTPEFFVKASAVKAAMRMQWCSGMRFKMAFETEDSSRISWFMGTIASVQVSDPLRWPNSPWRLLQVTWDEPDLLHNVKCVSPWLVELVSHIPTTHLSPFLPPRKKLHLLQHPDFPPDGQCSLPSISGNPLRPSSPMCFLSDYTLAGIQGARHAQFGISLSDLHFNSKLQSGLFPANVQRLKIPARTCDGILAGDKNSNENLSCLLTIGNSCQNLEKSDNVKRHQFLLFGQPILTEQQISRSSNDKVSQILDRKNTSDENQEVRFLSDGSGSTLEQLSPEKSSSAGSSWHQGFQDTELGLDTGHCKVFMQSEDVGRTLDLSVFDSYEELYRRLANMFGIERSDMLSPVLYQDATGAVKQTGDEPFSDFLKTAKRLTILKDSDSNNIRRTWVTGMRNAENGLDASNKTGPLSIFA
ncbi:auxin response factor 18-like isoform X1 [Juglans microcarpa x Juglans regia]|uniref:auxin response factor 18-like isoform X1 n=1 Tax=Juglans microcarpa x Juglans regia TaxID=2249226 RepID=UPI001B7E018E|nr:auxin response factor 18-like isoform X1 [Juglans microcarpa x Juglans regia]XP_040994779.1 auxin response factor 18-like isoform X1 [Juglans microcarpa x Juglans regia]